MKMPALLLFLIFFTTQIKAEEICPPEITTDLDVEEDLIKIQDKAIKDLDVLAGKEESFAKASCTAKKLPKFTFDGMDGDDLRLVSALTQFTKHTGYCNQSEESKCQKELSADALKCKDTKCKLITTFGKKESELMVYALENYKLNPSAMAFSPGYKNEVFKSWEYEELQDIVLGVMDMPPQMTGYLSNQQLTSRKAMQDELFSGTLADDRMTFNGLWAMQPSAERRTTAFHEFAHNFSHHFNVSTTDSWRKLTGWEMKKVESEDRWISRKPTAIVSQYGASSPEEDFAESVTAYRYNPKVLMKASPEKYRFIKEIVFGGVEYAKKNKKGNLVAIKTGQCPSFPPLPADWQDDVKKKLATWDTAVKE